MIAVAVSGGPQARAVREAADALGIEIILYVPPETVRMAGVAALRAIEERLGEPLLVDCGDRADRVMAGLREGLRRFVYHGDADLFERLDDMARQCGGRGHAVLDLPLLRPDPPVCAPRALEALMKRWREGGMSDFDTDAMREMRWLNEPPFWRIEDGVLHVRSGEKTDFWQGTHYGFHRDDGHFLHRRRTGDFTASATFEGCYEHLYDQAGMMVRIDAGNWIKFGIEFTDGARHLSTVVTRRWSDWSVQRLDAASGPVSVRVTRLGDALFVQHRPADLPWAMMRLAHFPPEPRAVEVGLCFCSPERWR